MDTITAPLDGPLRGRRVTSSRSWSVQPRMVAAQVVLHVAGWLLLWTVLPALLFGWQPFVISSGSMGPALRAGDVVLADPAGVDEVRVGQVVTFRDGPDGTVVTHRVVDHDRGLWITQGDRNTVVDSEPVAQAAVVGPVRLVVPLVGRPALWARDSPYLLVVAAGLGVATARLGGLWPSRWSRRTWVVGGAVAVAVAAPFTAPSAGAVLTGTTTSGGSAVSTVAGSWPSGCAGAGTYVLPATRDTWVGEAFPLVAHGSDTTLYAAPTPFARRRALLDFDPSGLPAGCAIRSAELELRVTTDVVGGSSLTVRPITSSWIEGTTTWIGQPTVGSITTTAAVPAGTTSTVTLDLQQPVEDWYAGGSVRGVRVADERSGVSLVGSFPSSEAATGRPRIVVVLW